MSSLWWSNMVIKKKNSFKKPSPKQSINLYNHFQSPARGFVFYHNKQFVPLFHRCKTIKGISPFISGRRADASMTVEAAVVLPLFLFFFLNLGCAIELIRLHGNLELALCDAGNRMSVYGYVLSETNREAAEDMPVDRNVQKEKSGDTKDASAVENVGGEESDSRGEWWTGLADVAFSYLYVKNQLVDYVGAEYLEESPIADGKEGLCFLESGIFDNKDHFEVIVTYKVSPFIGIAGFRPFRMANRYYGHIWNGYHIPGTGYRGWNEDLVYVAENGAVYHEDKNCSHLSLSVRETDMEEACRSRNVNGERYRLCEICGNRGYTGTVYITEDGIGIHTMRRCSGLKRTVYTFPRQKAGGYAPCKRCVRL